MGIEKLVPDLADLEVFLQLLPRSSTGERMNPYTSMWTGVTPGDGPQDVPPGAARQRPHRRAGRRASAAQALHCIRCSACLNVCPVYERTGGHAYGSVYPGPIGAVLVAAADRASRTTPRCRTRRRCAAPASTPARCGSTSRRCWCTCGPSTSRRGAAPAACRPPRRSRWRRRPGRWRGPRRFGRGASGRAGSGGCSAGARDRISRAAAAAVGVDGEPRPARCRRPRRSASGGRAPGARVNDGDASEILARIRARRSGRPPDPRHDTVDRRYRTAGDHATRRRRAARPARGPAGRLQGDGAAHRRAGLAAGDRPALLGAATAGGRAAGAAAAVGRRTAVRRRRLAQRQPTSTGSTAVVTGCAAVAVAETGTIVLDGGAGPGPASHHAGPRPSTSACVRADQVVQTVPEMLARLDPTPPADPDQRARRPPATSSSTGSRACTARGP